MKKLAIWVWYLVVLLSGVGFVYFSRPGVVVSLVIVGVLAVLAVLTGVVTGSGE